MKLGNCKDVFVSCTNCSGLMVAVWSLGSTEKSVLIELGMFAMGIGRGSESWQLLTS